MKLEYWPLYFALFVWAYCVAALIALGALVYYFGNDPGVMLKILGHNSAVHIIGGKLY